MSAVDDGSFELIKSDAVMLGDDADLKDEPLEISPVGEVKAEAN